MRYIKIFIIGLFSMLMIQVGILYFLEKVYLIDNAAYSSTKVENSADEAVRWSKLTLGDSNADPSVSYDGRYLAYLKDGSLYLVDSGNAKRIMVPADKNMEITYIKWIYDRNRLIMAERPVDANHGSYYKLFYYDMDKFIKTEIFNDVNNKSIRIPNHGGSEKISSIELSTLNNVIYVKLTDPDRRSGIYRINIMAQESQMRTAATHIGKIASTKRDDLFIYENQSNNKVYTSAGDTPIEIDGQSSFRLIGTDNDDNVYLAYAVGGKTDLIYFGNITDNKWDKAYLKKPTDPGNILVNLKGQIFVKDDAGSIINNIATGDEISYRGTLADMYQDGMISEQGRQIYNTILN